LPLGINEDAAEAIEGLVPEAERWELLRLVDSILKAYEANVKVKQFATTSQDAARQAQMIALHADHLFSALKKLNVPEGQPEPLGDLDWQRALDPLLKIVFAASTIARPTHKPGELVMLVSSFAKAFPKSKDGTRIRSKLPKSPHWPLGNAVAALVRCFRQYVDAGAPRRMNAFVLCALRASGPWKRKTERVSPAVLRRDYINMVKVDVRFEVVAGERRRQVCAHWEPPKKTTRRPRRATSS
jgi:hypothetical protein